MTSLKQKAIVCIVAAAGLKAYEYDTAPANQIPDDFTGTASLVCTGERYQLSDQNEKIRGTDQTIDPTILKLDFQSGRIAGWTASPTNPSSAEVPQNNSDLVTQFKLICSTSGSACLPTTNDKGDTQLYLFNYKAGDVTLGGTGLISKDLRNFAGYSNINGQNYANAMTCEKS